METCIECCGTARRRTYSDLYKKGNYHIAKIIKNFVISDAKKRFQLISSTRSSTSQLLIEIRHNANSFIKKITARRRIPAIAFRKRAYYCIL